MGKAKVDQTKCIGCASCTGVCPTGAITINASGVAEVDQEKCSGCGQCTAMCPGQAIENK